MRNLIATLMVLVSLLVHAETARTAYYSDTGSGSWGDQDNWFSDSGATTPLGRLPNATDHVDMLSGAAVSDGESIAVASLRGGGNLTLSVGDTLNLSSEVVGDECNCVIYIDGGEIQSGTYEGVIQTINPGGLISGGDFALSNITMSHENAEISGGTFHNIYSIVIDCGYTGSGGISGGTFSDITFIQCWGDVTGGTFTRIDEFYMDLTAGGELAAGTFEGTGTDVLIIGPGMYGGGYELSGGTFNCPVTLYEGPFSSSGPDYNGDVKVATFVYTQTQIGDYSTGEGPIFPEEITLTLESATVYAGLIYSKVVFDPSGFGGVYLLCMFGEWEPWSIQIKTATQDGIPCYKNRGINGSAILGLP